MTADRGREPASMPGEEPMDELEAARRARLAELAGDCFELAARLGTANPHDPTAQRLLDSLWLLSEALRAQAGELPERGRDVG